MYGQPYGYGAQTPLVLRPPTQSVAITAPFALSLLAAPTQEEARENLIPMTLNNQCNLDMSLYNAISQSNYFKQLLQEYPTFENILQVISEEIVHVEPLEPGKGKVASFAFCCIFKLFLIKLDQRQLRLMLNHKKNIVRACAVLYLRIGADVKQLYDWIEPLLGEPTLFSPSSDSKRDVVLGDWVLSTCRDIKYNSTVLRRIPQHILQKMERKAVEREVLAERSERNRYLLRSGLTIKSRYSDGQLYNARIDEVLKNGNFVVTYTEYQEQAEVQITDLEFDADALEAEGGGERDRSPARGRDRDRSDSRGRSKRDRSRDRDRKRDRDRSRDRGRDRDRGRRDRSRSRDRGRRSDRSDRDRSRDRGRDRDRRDDRGRNAAPPRRSGPKLTLEEEIEQRMKQKESDKRNRHVASDGNYAKLPTGYKKALGEMVETVNRPRFEPRS